MKTVDIREKLHHYIETAQPKKVKAIYAMVEDEIAETYDYWKDGEFLAELKQREEDFRLGKSKSYTLEETLKKVREAVKKVKRKWCVCFNKMNAIRFLERAVVELEDSSVWYEKQSSGLGDRFIDVVDKKLDLILHNPELFPIKKYSYREAVLATFPFSIVFRFEKKNSLVTIISIFHNKRNPKEKFKLKKP